MKYLATPSGLIHSLPLKLIDTLIALKLDKLHGKKLYHGNVIKSNSNKIPSINYKNIVLSNKYYNGLEKYVSNNKNLKSYNELSKDPLIISLLNNIKFVGFSLNKSKKQNYLQKEKILVKLLKKMVI